MRITILAMIVVIIAVTFAIGAPPNETKSAPAFDKLKSLVGTWQGKDEEGKPVTITYKIVSAGSSVMETLDMADNKETMITMYHLDGGKLMMTHYCSMGNQPRMRAEKMSGDGKAINFKFVDGTNLDKDKDSYMSKLVVTFKDADHFSQQWTMRMAENKEYPALFEFERVK